MSYTMAIVHDAVRDSNGLRNMGFSTTPWPEGLTDEEAVQRLRTLCLGACDGIQDLADDSRYKALRRALLSRPDLRPLAPAFIAAQAGLEAVVRHLRETRDRAARREMVREQFAALLDTTAEPAAIRSAGWTGRPSRRHYAAVVQALAPVALEAVERLIADEERTRGNGGPVDADRIVALQQLKALHAALGDLIQSVEQDRPLAPVVRRLQSIQHATKIAIGRATAALPVTSAALAAFGTVVGITEVFTGSMVVSIAAGGLAGATMKDAFLKGEPAAPPR